MITTFPKRASQPSPTIPPTYVGSCCHGPSGAPTHEEIARAAYDIYVEHGRTQGRCKQNWLQAEEELAQSPRGSEHQAATHCNA